MVFARCLAVESDLFFASTSARTTLSSRATHHHHTKSKTTNQTTPQVPSSSGATARESSESSIMPTFLNWARKSSNSNGSSSSSASATAPHTSSHHGKAATTASSNQQPSPHYKKPTHHHYHHKQRRCTKDATTTMNPKTQQQNPGSRVTYHRGEKSFLAFHQNYAITRHLGEGSYSTVKQVTHRKRGGLFACKIVDKSALSAVDRVALSHEVQVLAQVRHDHIMQLHEVIEDDTKCYLILELAEHGDLFDKIVKQGKFPIHEAQKVSAALCEALSYCHANAIIHRDVKPENVLLSGDASAIKLCDFGFAKQLSDIHEKSVDSCGTPGYAAPEILDGKPYGVEVDVFSLGVVMYIMLCGYPPFPMKLAQLRTHRFNVRFPSKDWSQIDSSVKELITRMLHVKPELRPTMAQLQQHAWIQCGKTILDEMRAESERRQREEALQRKQLIADTIRKKLTSTTGFDVVKHGRQGQPHRTKLRLSPDGRVLSWQPKLLKRGLLKYHQNAKSFTSFFGFGSSSSTNSSHNTKKSDPQRVVPHPQIARLSSLGAASRSHEQSTGGGRYSEPILCDDSTHRAIVGSVQLDDESMAMGDSQSHLSKTDSTTSTSSTGSATWIDKKNWWRSFRRSPVKSKVSATANASPTERSASGGFSCAAFSLANAPPAQGTARSLSTSSSSSCSDSYETTVDHHTVASRLSLSSSSEPPASPRPLSLSSPGSSSMGAAVAPPLLPSAAAATERMLDTAIQLKDIRSVTRGEDSRFFQVLTGVDFGEAADCQCSCPECSSRTISTMDESERTMGASSSSDDTTNEPSKKRSVVASSELNVAAMLTVATRYRELHLEFPSEELRDAFAFLLEQATLPLENVAQRQPSFILRSSHATTTAAHHYGDGENKTNDGHGSSEAKTKTPLPHGRIASNKNSSEDDEDNTGKVDDGDDDTPTAGSNNNDDSES